jgi:shikimate kinase
MGSGKSTIGRLVADRAGAPFHDLDRLIEERAGMSISELWEGRGESEFRRLEAALLPEVLAPGAVVSLGGGAPLSDENWRLIEERATSIFLDLTFEQLWARISGYLHRPLIHGRTQGEVAALLERRRPLYGRATFTVDASADPEDVAQEVLELWSR